jgi:predicted AAA+ superfamily ATPase
VKGYFDILVDTLLGRWLPAFRRRPKRRVIRASKFYFADVGVANTLARRGRLEPGAELFGKALESWVLHELSAYTAYAERDVQLSYWRLASGIEVDFIVGDMQVAIEVKAARRVSSGHMTGLRHLQQDHPELQRRLLVCLEQKARRIPDGIEILPARQFAHRLWDGGLF